jgi:hypothetical protein
MDNNPQKDNNTSLNKNQEKIGYVYRHIRLDKDEVFYIGIGTMDKGKYDRAYDKYGRNPFWNYIVNKTKYEVEILFENLPSKELYEKEKEFIKLYGRRDKGLGTLCNLTDGGEGNYGNTQSDYVKAKTSHKLITFDISGDVIKEYISLKSAVVDGFSHSSINDYLKGNLYSHNGFKFIRQNEKLVYGIRLTAEEKKDIKLKTSQRMSDRHDKIIIKTFDYYNNFIKEYPSIISMKKDGFSSTVGRCADGYGDTNNGFKFIRISDNVIHGYAISPDEHIKKQIITLITHDIDGTIIKKYDSLKSSKIDGFDKGAIRRCLDGKNKYHLGFTYKQISPTIIHGYKIPSNELEKIIKKDRESVTAIKLVLFDSNNEVIKKYDTLISSEKDGFDGGSIIKCVDGKQKTHKNFRFEKINHKIIHGYALSKQEIDANLDHTKKLMGVVLKIFNKDMVLERTFDSIKDADALSEFNYSGILNCINGTQKNNKGYTFTRISSTLIHGYPIKDEKIIYKRVRKPIGQYKDGVLIKEYPSIKSVKEYGYYDSQVSLCCNGKALSHKGFQWKFL